MKAQILKHTGLTEKQFYAKYKNPEDFFGSPEGKTFKKAQSGTGGGGFWGMGDVFKKFGSGIGGDSANKNMGPQNAPPQPPKTEAYSAPSNYAKQALPTQPDQGEMDAAKGLQKTASKEELQGEIAKSNQQATEAANTDVRKKNSTLGSMSKMDVAGGTDLVLSAVNTAKAFKQEKKMKKQTKMFKDVTGLALTAARTKPEKYDRQYVRPEDQTMTGEELFPIYGVGTNPIATGQNGSMIRSAGKTQNAFAPQDIQNVGYKSLNDTNLKRFQSGGGSSGGGMGASIAGQAAGPLNSGVSSHYKNNAGYQAGDTVGKVFKFIPGVGPIISALASPVLGAIGGQLDKTFGNAGKIAKNQAATERNVRDIGYTQSIAGMHEGSTVTRNGGMIDARNWNPQMISHYGKYSMKELMRPDPKMNTLEDGGSLAHGGELKTHWGGYYEPMSHNPYLPDGGESVMFRGNTHHQSDGRGNKGIGVTYGNSPVEVERGEPAMKLQSGGGESDMVVFGNLMINKQNAGLIGDSKAANKRFKNYIADLNKQENKHNKTLNKNTKDLNELQVIDPYDRLAFNSYQANMKGSDMHLKNIADKKQKAGHLQNAINQTRDELSDALGYTVSAEQLSKNGDIVKDKDPVTKIAKYGAILDKYQDGSKPRRFKSEEEAITAGFKKNDKGVFVKAGTQGTTKITKKERADALAYVPTGQKRKSTGVWGKVTPDQVEQLKQNNPWYDWTGFDPNKKNDVLRFQQEFNNKAISIGSPARIHQDDALGEQTVSAKLDLNKDVDITPPTAESAEIESPEETGVVDKNNWWNLMGAALPYIRPSNAEAIDPNQFMGEMYALSNNQVEPVFGQSYQPQLDIPYDISLQDQLNEVTAQTRGAQRMAGYNPAAQAAIASAAYDPANKILGEQFRLNQAEKAGVYDRNRATMNDARKTNIGLYDTQQQRQSQALSNTKAINQAALNSISDKYAQNSLQNKTLQTYENLYNYRYGPNMKAYNMNPLFNPNMPQVYHEGEGPSEANNYTLGDIYKELKGGFKKDKSEEPKKEKEEAKKTRNGSIVRSLKRM